MIHVRYDGEGELHETDPKASKVDGYVPNGGTFQTTQARYDELVAQGINVTKVDAPKAEPAAKPADTGKEKS